ncbi:DUF6085 family protein [Streptomyces sp. NPDC001288]
MTDPTARTDRVTAAYDSIVAFQRKANLSSLRLAQIRMNLAEHLADTLLAFPSAVSVRALRDRISDALDHTYTTVEDFDADRAAAAVVGVLAADTQTGAAPLPSFHANDVQGFCPACGHGVLMLDDGGHVVCTLIDCPNPDAVDELLRAAETQQTQTETRESCTRIPHCDSCNGFPDDTDLTEADVDRMMAAGTPVQIVTQPPATYAAGRVAVTDAQEFHEPDEDAASVQAAFEEGAKHVTAVPAVPVEATTDNTPHTVAWSDGRGHVYCLECHLNVPNTNVRLSPNDVEPHELCPSCGRHVVDVASGTA